MAIYSIYKIRRFCQYTCQLIILTLGKAIFLPVTQRDTSVIDSALQHKPYIIVANHKRSLDPFVTICGLPYRHTGKVLPIAFMTANFFYDSFIRPLCWLSGCFPARNPKGKHTLFGVDGSITLLQNGFSIFVFPEGKRIKGMERGPAHTGVTRIHHALPDVPILLCHMRYNNGLKALLTGKRFDVRYKIAEKAKYSDPESIMDELFAL